MAGVTNQRRLGVIDAPAADIDIAVEAISQRFPTPNGVVTALDNISFKIERGKFVGLIGPSGCGKSSLLMILAGLVRASEGRISVRGKEITGPDPERIGVVFQDASLLPWKTAIANVEFPLKLRGVTARERRERAEQLLELVGLKDFKDHHPHELSGGMRQRVSIARGLCQNPEILLMDEPFAALDEQTRMTMGDELLQIWERHRKTVVFVTHSLTEAVYLCDEVLVMSHRPGRILERLSIDLPRPRTYDMMATDTFGILRDQIWRLIRKD
ncbi:MAG TPA: ABC transporter ATP-binding protein [Dongiaceae bacterium]|nr:ABC transporter ATP-binding protein [Dongiaceae bacterium]